MQFIFNRHLLTYSLFWFLPLSLTYLQATEEQNYGTYFEINFWTIKKDGIEKLLEDSDKQKLIEGIKKNKVASKYSKRSYPVKLNTPSWPPVLKFLEESGITVGNPWLDLNLIYMENMSNSETDIEEEEEVENSFAKSGILYTDMDIIITKKKKETKKPINLVVKNWNKKLEVYPTTKVDDLHCYLIYHSDMPQEEKDYLYDGSYFLKPPPNQPLKNQSQDYRYNQIKDINNNQFVWISPPNQQFICSFYLNKNGTLLSNDQISDSRKVKKGIQKEWDCIKVRIPADRFLLPVVSQIVPNISVMDIKLLVINDHYNILKKYHPYMIGKKEHYMTSITTSIFRVDKSAKFILVEYKKKSEKKIKCILKKEGSSDTILEKTLSINRANEVIHNDTHFIDVYLYLANQAGYKIDPFQMICPSPTITYKTKGNHSKGKRQVKKEYIYDSMFEHQKGANIESYTFIMPKSAKLKSKEDKLDILPKDKHPFSYIIKYIMIPFAVTVATAGVGYLIWRVKKKKK